MDHGRAGSVMERFEVSDRGQVRVLDVVLAPECLCGIHACTWWADIRRHGGKAPDGRTCGGDHEARTPRMARLTSRVWQLAA